MWTLSPRKRADAEELSVMASVPERFLEQERRDQGPVVGTLQENQHPFLQPVLYNQVTIPSVPDHPETLWSFKCDSSGKTIYGHRWEGGTSALSSNYINRDTPDGTELCVVDIKLMLHKCQLFRSGFLQVWPMGHFIEIVRECWLQLQIPGPTPRR